MNELSEITAVLHSGELYDSGDPALLEIQSRHLDAIYDFNNTRPSETARRLALLKEMLAEVGEGCWIEPPFHANWGAAVQPSCPDRQKLLDCRRRDHPAGCHYR